MPRDPETQRLIDDAERVANWKRWGPYLSERQWGTVREDYSADGDAWKYFPFDHAAARAYRWGEDGLLGICDRQCRACFAVALWNGRDPLLKERLFGLANPEGNHGEDVKEEYYYLDATPTASYLKAMYRYPHMEFPYQRLRDEGRRRGRGDREFELADAGAFAEDRFTDVVAEYAKAAPEDILIRISATNRGPEPAKLWLLPTFWCRDTWTWGCTHEGCEPKPRLHAPRPGTVALDHASLGQMELLHEGDPPLLFTDNISNKRALWGVANDVPHVKDAFHDFVLRGRADAVNPRREGTKAAALHEWTLAPGETRTIRLRLCRTAAAEPFGPEFDRTFAARIAEADAFYASRFPAPANEDERLIHRSASAGLLWSKQFSHYVVRAWLKGDPFEPTPPGERRGGRNRDWQHVFQRDVLAVPDKWEYPWFAAWDHAFHMVALARLDPKFAKEQMLLLLREWYLHPNGQLPAYEWDFGDVNPPVHAWGCLRVYKQTGRKGQRDVAFLERCFQKLLLNFTWWVNRKDEEGNHLFGGGFLGLDNIGVVDRSKLPPGYRLEQADGTAWMAFYCVSMLSIALELALHRPVYEDIASKFFEHFVAIADAMNTAGGHGLWHEEDGFYYDHLRGPDGVAAPLRSASVAGLVPLFATLTLEAEHLDRLPGFRTRLQWFLDNRPELAAQLCAAEDPARGVRRLLAVPTRDRLERALRRAFDEAEFLSPHGVRSLSRRHLAAPFALAVGGAEQRISYVPGESDTGMFGGNSNWRGPIWLPMNFLLIDALERWHYFLGDGFQVEFPTGSGRRVNLKQASEELAARVCGLFAAGPDGRRPWHGDEHWRRGPGWRDLRLFHEYFHGDDGRGLGASHQTGWTALVAKLLEDRRPKPAGYDPVLDEAEHWAL